MTITPTQLRASAARQRAAAPDGATVPLADELEAAATEIERLTPTSEDRRAIEDGINCCLVCAGPLKLHHRCDEAAGVLRRFVKRTERLVLHEGDT